MHDETVIVSLYEVILSQVHVGVIGWSIIILSMANNKVVDIERFVNARFGCNYWRTANWFFNDPFKT